MFLISCFFFSSRRRHTRLVSDWSSDVCSSDLHQFRIDRRAPHRRIVRCKFAAKPGQIESSIDLPHQMIFRNRVAKSKLVEQLTLVTLQTAHHGSTSPRFASTKRNHASRPLSTDFCNKICHEQRYFYYLAIRQANNTTVAPSAAAITDVTIPPPSARSTAM